MASEEDNIYVTYVDIDRELLKIWGQRSRVGATFIERQLLQLVPTFNKTKSPSPSSIRKGMFCFAKYTDNNYYRARVISNVQSNSVNVLFVDYGNKDLINISSIRVQEGSDGEVLSQMAEQAEEFYLAQIREPDFGWKSEIIGDIRRDICYEEFPCKVITQVGDQKILEVNFQNENFSDYLVKKQYARPVSLKQQTEMVLSYCSLVSNDSKQFEQNKEIQCSKGNFATSNSNVTSSARGSGRYLRKQIETNQQLSHDNEGNLAFNSTQYTNSKQENIAFNTSSKFSDSPEKMAEKTFYSSSTDASHKNHLPSINSKNNSLLYNQSVDVINQTKEKTPLFTDSFNKEIVEELAKQIKQYIIKENTKSKEEQAVYHYVNDVLETGKTYNVFISCIDDGPWSFSVRLLSNETEFDKITNELSSVELVNVKSPFVVGQPCVAVNKYNFCRGVIVGVSHAAVNVYFVDCGNTEALPVALIFELPPQFFKIKVLSYKFCLHGMQNVGYSEDIKQFFIEAVKDKVLVLLVTSIDDDNLPTCDLFINNINIKQILNNKMRGYKTSPIEFLNEGDTQKVVVTWVISPQKFFIQLRKNDSDLRALKNELNEVSIKGLPLTFQELYVGFKCICCYQTDGNWYRVIVTSLVSENVVKVFYMDYGNSEVVEIKLLRRYENLGLITQMCPQAIPCCLIGFENEPCSQEVFKRLENLILEKDLDLTVISLQGEKICVKLCDKGNDISSLLSGSSQRNGIPRQKEENIWESARGCGNPETDSGYNFAKKNKSPGKGLEVFIENKMRDEVTENSYENNRLIDNENGKKFTDMWSNQKFSESQDFNWEPEAENWGKKNFNERKKIESNKDNRNKFIDDEPTTSYSEKKNDKDWGHIEKFSNDHIDLRNKSDKGFKENSWERRDRIKKDNKFERNDRIERENKWSRNDGGERNDRFDKGSSWNKNVKEERIIKGFRWKINDRSNKSSRYEKGEKYERNNKWEKNDKFDGGNFSGKINKWEGGDKRDRSNRWEINDKSDRGNRNFREDRNEKSNRDDRGYAGDKFNNLGKSFLESNNEDETCYEKPVEKENLASPGSKFNENSIKVGDCEKGIVTYYFNPHEFFIQTLTQEKEFRKMMNEIQHYYCDKLPLQDSVEAGDIVIAQFSMDKILYRCEIIKPSPVTVRYVDYGNQEPVNSKRIWPVDKKFLSLPSQVIKCKLANIEPIGDNWPPPGSEIDKFFESDEYEITVLDFKDGFYEITMKCMATGKDIGNELILAGLARGIVTEIDISDIDYSLLPNQILRLNVTHVDSSSKFYVVLNNSAVETIEDEIKFFTKNKNNIKTLPTCTLEPGDSFLVTEDEITWHRGTLVKKDDQTVIAWLKDKGRTIEVNVTKVAELPENLKNIPPQAVECKLLENSELVVDEDDFKESVSNKDHMVSIVSVNDDKLIVELYNSMGQKVNFLNVAAALETLDLITQLPLITQNLKVRVPHAETPNEIYIQRASDMNDLETLCSELNKFYFHAEGLDEFEDKPEFLVAAKSLTFNSWYRGRIVASFGDELDIFYIDFGNQERLPRENVKKLEISFCKDIPAFARKVLLDVNYKENLEEEIVKKILEFTKEKEVFGYFINKDGEFLSELIVEGERLSSVLELGGLVLKKETDEFKYLLPNEKITESSIEPSETLNLHDAGQKNDSKVIVTHIESPSQFWVHKESLNNDLLLLQDKLQQICEDFPEKKNLKPNDFVAVKYSDTWYRAEVLKKDENKITVRFIDYGNDLNLDLNSSFIKELPPEIIKVPNFAVRRSLIGEWNEEATFRFEAIILQQEDPVTELILEEGDPAIVDLYLNDQSISEELLKGSENEVDEEDLQIVYISHINSPDDFYIQKDSCTNSLDEINSKLLDYENFEDIISVQENEIYAAKFPEDGVWYRAKAIKNLSNGHEVLFIDYGNISVVTELKTLPDEIALIPQCAENCSLIFGNTTDDWSEAAKEKFAEYVNSEPLKMKVVIERPTKSVVRLYSSDNDISEELATLCEPDNRSEFYITHVSSPNDFYIQLAHDEQNSKVLEYLQNTEEFDELQDKSPGTICAAIFDEDYMWYRAKIVQNLDEGCEVFFLDYGNVGVSTNLKKLPDELENIPPRALRCRLNLVEQNIPESIKEEFINLTSVDESVFRVKFISQEEINVVSLKLNGRILEKTLGVDFYLDQTELIPSPWRIPRIIEDETDDDKNSKLNVSTETFLSSNFEDVRVGNYTQNETDEEKRVKIAIADGCTEGFKSDDEKSISEGAVLSTVVNATDNELIEEIQESHEETVEGIIEVEREQEIVGSPADEIPSEEIVDNSANESPSEEIDNVILDSKNKTENDNRGILSDVQNVSTQEHISSEEIVCSSVSRDEKEKDLNGNVEIKYRKTTHSEKVVSGSISLGASLDTMPVKDDCSVEIQREISQSAPTSPRLSRHEKYVKIDRNDRNVPGCISGEIPLSFPLGKKISPTEKIVPGSVSGSFSEN